MFVFKDKQFTSFCMCVHVYLLYPSEGSVYICESISERSTKVHCWSYGASQEHILLIAHKTPVTSNVSSESCHDLFIYRVQLDKETQDV